MSRSIKFAVLLGGILGAWSCAPYGTAEQPPAATEVKQATADEIAAWIKNLDDPRYRTREEATQHLLAAGEPALETLLVVANGDRPEPADRAIWILRRVGRSRDNDLAMAALGRLVQLQNRPAIVAKAESDLAERSISACQQRLGPLGAEIESQLAPIDIATMAPVLIVRLGDKWQGTTDDLRQLAQLRHIRHFRLEGFPISDDVVKLFAEKEKLAYLQLVNTKVTPDAVDAIKVKHPETSVLVRNQALLGVSAANHPAGVMVTSVRPGTAAANAGIVEGDIIATIDGHPLPDFDRLTVRIAQHRPGDKIDVEIIRNNERMKLIPVLGSWAGQEQ
jgi:hypothetical protein